MGPLAGAATYVTAAGLPVAQRSLASVLVFVIVYWVTEAIPIPVTALLGLALCALTGVAPAEDIFGAFSTATVFLFIGAFMIARAMTLHGLDRRFAYWVLSLPGVADSTYRIVVAFGVTAAALSAVISNTAAVAMLTPVAIGTISTVSTVVGTGAPTPRVHPRLAAATLLMTAYGASIGGLLTPVGSPPNLIGRRLLLAQTGVGISFVDWVRLAVPIVVVAFGLLSVLLLVLNRPELRALPGAADIIRGQRAALGRLSRGERNTLIAFAVAVTGWVLPGVLSVTDAESSTVGQVLSGRLDEGVVAILAAAVLFVLPLDWRRWSFTLSWEGAARIDWGTILLFGSGIAIGSLLGATGLAAHLGETVAAATGVSTAIAVTLAATLAAVLLSEASSNTAAVSIVVPVVIPIALAAGVSPVAPAIAATFAASYGFMLPVSTPPNAIVYGTGLVPLLRMIRSGLVFDVLGIVIIVSLVGFLVSAIGLGA